MNLENFIKMFIILKKDMSKNNDFLKIFVMR